MAASSQTGTGISVEELMQIRRDALQLGVLPGDAMRSLFPGAYRAVFHGRGIEFDEVRNYQSGDDYRTIDWRVTARSGQLHTKLFQEERERALYLVLDAGPSMQFGTKLRFKWVQGARVAALFAWLSLASGNRVGAVVFGDGKAARLLTPGAGETGVMRILHLLAGLQPVTTPQAGSMNDALRQLRQRARPGSLILLLSDFVHIERDTSRHLSHLGRHCDLAAARLFDPIERELPPPGRYPVTDGEKVALLDTCSSAVRGRFSQRFASQGAKISALFNRFGARTLAIATDQPLVEGIRQSLIPMLPRAGNGTRRPR